MISKDLLYQLSLCDIPTIGPVHAKVLAEHFGCALDIFKAKFSALEQIEGIGRARASSIKKFNNFNKAEKEIAFIEKYGISPLFITDEAYPKRLLNCYDPPALLFFKGNADLNRKKIVSVVGTRNHSSHGKIAAEKLVQELVANDILIVSGLAYGIDAIAHRTALQCGAQTVGVIAHGLDIIYPSENTWLARDMLKQGGLLTEFRSRTKPDKHHFPSRNRIVAGISDATVIIESGVKGGSMITAEIAFGYSREIFALPGRITDSKSSGCHYLIRSNKAILLENAQQLLEVMGWKEEKESPELRQADMFAALGENEKKIIGVLRQNESLTIDELYMTSGITAGALSSALLHLEMHDITKTLPGKRYALSISHELQPFPVQDA